MCAISKYNALWDYLRQQNAPMCRLTFDEIGSIAGVALDHSFLNCKREAEGYGWQVGKISMKERTVVFTKR